MNLGIEAVRRFAPRERVPMRDWFPDHINMSDGAAVKRWSNERYPHFAAPNGPMDAYQDPKIRQIWLQFASRLGKTAFGLSAMVWQAANNPCPMLFGSSTQTLAVRVSTTKIYPMIERSPLAGELKPANRRQQTRIDLGACRIYIAWSGSSSELADLSARILHANEIDKWDGTASPEADPLKLFMERAKEFPNRKIVLESTPGLKSLSRVERGRLASDNRSYWVPCPHCSHYQKLKMGDGESPGGIQWDRGADGKSDPDTAKRTARYVCESCEGHIRDHHRAKMMRSGVWAKAGQRVIAGELVGEALRSGDSAGFQLSSLYALSLGWGDIAQEFIKSKGRSRELQNFVNSWLAETWEARKTKSLPEKLAERLCVPGFRRRIVPEWVQLLTAGCDKQGETGDFFPFTIWGHGENGRTALIDWGEAFTTDELWRILDENYQYEDGGQIRISLSLLDSGFKAKDVYDFCSQHYGKVFPCKGSTTKIEATGGYRVSVVSDGQLAAGRHRMTDGQDLYLVGVCPDYWEQELQDAFDGPAPDEPGGISFPEEVGADIELLEELCNAALVDKADSRGDVVRRWVKADEGKANDKRDATRYARVAARVWLDEHNGRLPARRAETGERRLARPTPAYPGRADGRPWIW